MTGYIYNSGVGGWAGWSCGELKAVLYHVVVEERATDTWWFRLPVLQWSTGDLGDTDVVVRSASWMNKGEHICKQSGSHTDSAVVHLGLW